MSRLPVIDFTLNVRGAHHDQLDCSLILRLDGRGVGYIDFCEFEGRPHIQMINVAEDMRRQKIATRLLAELQSRYPTMEIDWGMTSGSGSALKSALPTIDIPTPDAESFARLERLQLRLQRMENTIVDRRRAGEYPRDLMKAYYCLETHVDHLAWRLRDSVPNRKILDIDPISIPALSPAFT